MFAKINCICLLLLLLCTIVIILPTTSLLVLPSVTVDQGEIIGIDYVTSGKRIINVFYGIPYAAPPVLKNRFKPPQPLKPWAGFWNASKPASPCIQYNHGSYEVVGEEDCLYLNVFTPELPVNGVSKLMDVLVDIHGGAFMFGSSIGMLPDYLLRHADVVLVTINYRLGPLGFFSTGDQIVPGNNGLKDQVAALKWVHHNIIKFGGNPSSVTISGMSAGGASVHYHYFSPSSQGLFQRGISFSGTVFPVWTLPKNVIENSIKLASYFGCSAGNVTKDTMKCLQRRPAKQIVETVPTFMNWKYCPFTVFGPVIEPANNDPFLTEDPVDVIQNGRITNVPWLTSLCKDEGLYPVAEFVNSDELMKQLNDGWYDIAPYLFQYNYLPSEEAKTVSSKIKEFYFGENVINRNVANEITRAVGDRLFHVPIKKAVKLHASVSTAPVYCYTFNYRGKYSLSNEFSNNLDDYGVSHGDDVSYMFKVDYAKTEETKADNDMIDFMTNIVLSFIRSEKVNEQSLNNNNWKPVSADSTSNLDCLEINSVTDTRSVDTFNSTTHDFWNSILPERFLTTKVNPKSEPRVEL